MIDATQDAVVLYTAAKGTYERVAEECADQLKRACFGAGVPCTVSRRVKDLGSLLKKMLRKKASFDAVGDKIGVRVVVAYPRDYANAAQLIEGTVRVEKKDDKALLLGTNRFGYSATHFDCFLNGPQGLREHRIEVQLHTPGMALWSGIAHDLAYKAIRTLTPETERAVHRISAVTELVDDEARRIHKMIDERHGAAAESMLATLERHFYLLAQRDYDQELSLLSIEALLPIVGELLPNDPVAEIDRFAGKNTSHLRRIFAKYAADERHLLLGQPEVILVFLLLSKDKFALRDGWPALLFGFLEPLAAVWGDPIPESA